MTISLQIVWHGPLGELITERFTRWRQENFPEVTQHSIRKLDGTLGVLVAQYPHNLDLKEVAADYLRSETAGSDANSPNGIAKPIQISHAVAAGETIATTVAKAHTKTSSDIAPGDVRLPPNEMLEFLCETSRAKPCFHFDSFDAQGHHVGSHFFYTALPEAQIKEILQQDPKAIIRLAAPKKELIEVFLPCPDYVNPITRDYVRDLIEVLAHG